MATFLKNSAFQKNIPWVEKYRPEQMGDIILSDFNKKILEKMIKKNDIPNLLFYGPPGTGKTTTIINLLKELPDYNEELVIHLNASDDRGVEIVRSNIQHFVNSNNLFHKGRKYVILDEVDYMTINAQQLLKTLIQSSSGNISFFLICNYISKIDKSLQNDFLEFKFNKLPKKKIIMFLKNICKQENVEIKNDTLEYIQEYFESDIRSMINYIQVNQNILMNNKIINHSLCNEFLETLKEKNSFQENITYLTEKCKDLNIDKNDFMHNIVNYIIKNKRDDIILIKKLLNKLDEINNFNSLNSYQLNHKILVCFFMENYL